MANERMAEEDYQLFWGQAWGSYYTVYFQELLAERITRRLVGLDRLSLLGQVVAATASGVVGWALWQDGAYRSAWAVLAGVASVLAITRLMYLVSSRVRDAEAVFRGYRALRLDVEAYTGDLRRGLAWDIASARTSEMRERFVELEARAPAGGLATRRLRGKVQTELNAILRVKR